MFVLLRQDGWCNPIKARRRSGVKKRETREIMQRMGQKDGGRWGQIAGGKVNEQEGGKRKGGGNQERDLITVGSEGIKREMRETCVIAPLPSINTNLERWCVRVPCVPCVSCCTARMWMALLQRVVQDEQTSGEVAQTRSCIV